DDTWTWDGSNWTQQRPATSPPKRFGAVMTYDVARDRVVLFGGQQGADAAFLGDTWTWDGRTWARQATSAAPTPRAFAAMSYDPSRNLVVLFGGTGTEDNIFGDTWIWNGSAWTQAVPGTNPSPRFASARASLPSSRGVLLFIRTNDVDDSWSWDAR